MKKRTRSPFLPHSPALALASLPGGPSTAWRSADGLLPMARMKRKNCRCLSLLNARSHSIG